MLISVTPWAAFTELVHSVYLHHFEPNLVAILLLGNDLKKPLQCATCPSAHCVGPILLLAATGNRCQGAEDNFPVARNIWLFGKLKQPSCWTTSPVSLLVVQCRRTWAGSKTLLFQPPSAFRWLLNVEDLWLCPKDLVSWKLLSLSMAPLFLSWASLLASDLTTLLLFRVASSFHIKGLCHVLHQGLLTFSWHTSLLPSVCLTHLQAALWKTYISSSIAPAVSGPEDIRDIWPAGVTARQDCLL